MAEVAVALRIAVTAENTPALQACVDAAAFEIDDAMDRVLEVIDRAAWLFDDATAATDPGTGQLRLDHQSPAAADFLYASTTDADAVAKIASLTDLVAGDVIRLYDGASTVRWEQFTVTAAVVDHLTWVEIPVQRTDASPDQLTFVDGMRLEAATLRLTPLVAGKLALANRVNVLRAVEWWKANDAAIGAVGFDQTGQLQVPRSTFSLRHGGTLTPLKQRFGVA